MKINDFIDKAIEGGWRNDIWEGYRFFHPHLNKQIEVPTTSMFLDPDAWAAVGKVEGWTEDDYFCSFGSQHPTLAARYAGKAYVMDTWQRYMLGMTEALIEGKTIEQYLETL